MGKTILILRPEFDVEDRWTHELEGSGHTVLYAEEGKQALVHIRCCPVDCVVIDTGIEGVDRVQTFVTELELEHNAPPIILVSSSPAAPTFSAKLGAAAFLPKPLQKGELGHVLERMTPVAPTPRLATAP